MQEDKNKQNVFGNKRHDDLRKILLYAIRKECYSDWGSDNGCPHCRYSNNEKVKELCAHFYKKNNSVGYVNHLRNKFDNNISNTYFKNIFKEHNRQIFSEHYYLDEKARDVIFSIFIEHSISLQKALQKKYSDKDSDLITNEYERLSELADEVVDNLKLAISLKELNKKSFNEYIDDNTENINCINEKAIKYNFLNGTPTFGDLLMINSLMINSNNNTINDFFDQIEKIKENIDDLYTRYSLLGDALDKEFD